VTTLFVGALLALARLVGEAPPTPEASRPTSARDLESAPSSDNATPPESDAGEADARAEEPLRGQPGIRKLDPKSRAKVMSAMAAFVILWLAIIVFIWLGARYTRRYMHGTLRSSFSRTPVEEDDWARKKLVPETDDEP
jgi:hypothetical protein